MTKYINPNQHTVFLFDAKQSEVAVEPFSRINRVARDSELRFFVEGDFWKKYVEIGQLKEFVAPVKQTTTVPAEEPEEEESDEQEEEDTSEQEEEESDEQEETDSDEDEQRVDYTSMLKADLIAECEKRELTLDGKEKRDDLIAILVNDDADAQ